MPRRQPAAVLDRLRAGVSRLRTPAPAPAAGSPELEQRIGELQAALARVEEQLSKLTPADTDILDAYCHETPSPQTAVDIFAGEWALEFPPPLDGVRAGGLRFYWVPFVDRGMTVLGGVEGRRVLELGPLEGGHTYMLDRLGASEIVAVEANTRAFLKCLIVKELLGIPSARFLCGDFVRYMERELSHDAARFDICLASGVLYHLREPVAGLDLMCRSADRLLLWTHYYDHDIIQARPDLSVKFPTSTTEHFGGHDYTLYRQEYQHSLEYRGFCGGSAASSAWLSREDILAALDRFGFEVLEISQDEPEHPHGPCFCVAAQRRSA